MRGVIETYDGNNGTIRAKSGTVYPFARAAMVRRSRTPVVGARIVFRLKNGTVYRAAAGPDPLDKYWQWDLLSWPLEWLLYLP